jgi:hypothetical protein
MKTRLNIFFGLILFFSSCEEKTDWDIQQGNLNTLVVEAIITNEYKQQLIKLSKPYPDLNGQSVTVSGAEVSISAENQVMNFIESTDTPGCYFSENPIGASIDKTYVLNIGNEGETYTAEAFMVPVIPSWPIQIVPVEDNLREIEWTAPGYDPEDLAMYEVIISWTHLTDTTLSDTLTKARMFYYTLNTIDVAYVVFPQEKEEVLFPPGSILIAKKYSCTEDYAAYLRALLAETDWQGSLFEDARGNLPTNISNGGLGYFSACSVVADTIVVE